MTVLISDMAWVPLKGYPVDRLLRLKQRLTLTPKRTSEHQEDDDLKPVPLFEEREGYIGTPRIFFLKNKNPKHELDDQTTEGRPISFEFNGELIGDQNIALAAFDRRTYGGVIKARPGWGKTVVGIACWINTGCNAVVVVDKEFLKDQWIKRIETFAPDARIGIVQGDKCEFGEDVDVSVAMLQSLISRREKYPKELWGAFGMAIFDEVHRIGAPGWMPIASIFKARKRLGLSATPNRRDGMDNVLFWNFGTICHTSKVRAVVPSLRRIFTTFEFKKNRNFDYNTASKEIQLRLLCANPARNALIVEETVKAGKAGRKVMVMSSRRKHLERLAALFEKKKPEGCTFDFYVGQRKREELEKAEKATVIFCTYQMAKEALDIPALDTLMLTTPMADVEQATGRIMRKYEGKKKPIVTDFIDPKVERFWGLWQARLRFYRREGIYNGD
jgi:superfamily II DNA or RNA helicase